MITSMSSLLTVINTDISDFLVSAKLDDRSSNDNRIS